MEPALGKNQQHDPPNLDRNVPHSKRARIPNSGIGSQRQPNNQEVGPASGIEARGSRVDEGTGSKSRPSYNRSLGANGLRAATQEQDAMDEDDVAMATVGVTEWQEVRRTKDRLKAAGVFLEDLYGTTVAEKKKDLETVLLDAAIYCTEGPHKVKVNGYTAFRVAVEDQPCLTPLLEMTATHRDEDGNEHEVPLFFKINTDTRERKLERTVEVYGIAPRTPEFLIKSAMLQFGTIEKIATRLLRLAVKITAAVVYNNVEDVTKFKWANREHVFNGKELARIRKIGNERVEWTLTHVAKISGLPFGTTDKDSEPLLGEKQANFVKVPRYFSKDGKKWQYQREAFVYFPSAEAMAEIITKPVKIGGIETFWGDRDDKRCRQCHKPGHIMRECEVFIALQETKQHIKAVKEYQKGGALKVVPQLSYAKAATGKSGSVPQSNQQKAQEEKTNTQSSGQTNVIGKNSNTGAVDKKIQQLVDAVERLREKQQQLRAQNSLLIQMLIGMMSQHLG
ncbi:hypothetical protein BCR41DRAFT_365574, partial [Lobosporangium transversale]